MLRKSRWGARCFSSYSESGGSLPKIDVDTAIFPELRTRGSVYVDKTPLLPALLSGRQYFLSRPRKFGKSMLLSTIQSVFMKNGAEKAALFKGLWVADKSPVLLTKEVPVLSLDFSTLKLDKGGEQLEESLLQKLQQIAQQHDIAVDGLDMPNSAAKLVHKLSETTKEKKVVLLIDEVRLSNLLRISNLVFFFL